MNQSESKPFSGSWIKDYQEAFGMNGMVLMSWWMGAMFAEKTRSTYGLFPSLKLEGEPGTGKSTMVDFLWRCCGQEHGTKIDPSMTSVTGFLRYVRKSLPNLPIEIYANERGYKPQQSKSENEQPIDLHRNQGKSMFQLVLEKEAGFTMTSSLDDALYLLPFLIQGSHFIDPKVEDLKYIIPLHCCRDDFSNDSTQKVYRLKAIPTVELSSWHKYISENQASLLVVAESCYQSLQRRWIPNDYSLTPVFQNFAKVAAWSEVLPQIFRGTITREYSEAIQEYISQEARRIVNTIRRSVFKLKYV